jgi:Protein of unknown function (DUF1266)
MLRGFEHMSRGQEILGRALVAIAIIFGGVALIAYGILSETKTPPESGFMFVAASGSVAALSVFSLVWLGVRASKVRTREQQLYYERAQLKVPVGTAHLEALQLDGVNAESTWTETLEPWPAEVRFPDGAPKFRTFTLLTREQAKIQLDRDWGVLSREGYRETVESLFAGLHSLQFLELARGEQGQTILSRIAQVAELPQSDVESALEAKKDAPAHLLWAWDLWRVIPLSRNSFVAGLVSEEEAWENILRASKIVHALFRDLPTYHQNLRIGHAFWCDDYGAARERRACLEAFEKNDAKLPIRAVPWTWLSIDTLPPHIIFPGEDFADKPGDAVGAAPKGQLH